MCVDFPTQSSGRTLSTGHTGSAAGGCFFVTKTSTSTSITQQSGVLSSNTAFCCPFQCPQLVNAEHLYGDVYIHTDVLWHLKNVTACLLGCYTSLYCHSAYQLWTWTRSLSASNWIDIWQNIGAFKIPGIVKLQIFPANSANLSSKDRPATWPRCRIFLTATDNKIFKFSTPIICGKDPETRPFSASA